jgi:hypothetical protein
VEEASRPEAPALEAPGWVARSGVVIEPELLPVDPLCVLDGVPASGHGAVWFVPPPMGPVAAEPPAAVLELPTVALD